jgi:uncharacterized protein with HEPN domain
MSPSPEDFLGHILLETTFLINLAQEFEAFDREIVANNPMLSRATIRNLKIIGEATKNLPDALKSQYPAVPWRQIAGMRDKLIHGYFGIDYDVVWNVITQEIPALHEQVQRMLEDIAPC